MDNNYFDGYPTMPIDKSLLFVYLQSCIAHGVKYGLGAKDPDPKQFLPIDFNEIDCSGFVREIIGYATDGAIMLPDGSYNQRDWLSAHGYKKSSFSYTGLKDNIVRICVYEQPGHTGHIWVTYQGQTYESHGGVGPSSRPWNNPIMLGIAVNTEVFEVA